MEMGQRIVDGIPVVSVSGRIDGVTSMDLEVVLDGLIDKKMEMIIVDFSEVEYISSAGLRVLIAALKKLRAMEGDLVLISLRPFVREVFEMTGFTKLFVICSDVGEAMERFRS